MPAKREMSMRQLRHLLRLHHDGVSAREIGRRLGVARSTIQDNLKRAAAAGLAWPLADDITDEALERQLSGRAGVAQGQRRRVERTGRPGARAEASWRHDDDPLGGIPRGPFRGLRLQPFLRSAAWIRTAADPGDAPAPRRRGEGVRRLFGQTDRDHRSVTGEIREAEIFVGVLGASNFTFAKATWTQALPDWIGAHVRVFEAIGGVAEAAGAGQSEDRGHQGLASTIPRSIAPTPRWRRITRTAILPARPRKPRDKAKASYCTLSR